MKPSRFHVPGSLLVERHLRREGPSPVFVAWKPHTSRLFYERSPLLKFCAWPASTPTGQEFREWLKSFEETEPAPEIDLARIEKEGFGPEAHGLDESDPTHATRPVI